MIDLVQEPNELDAARQEHDWCRADLRICAAPRCYGVQDLPSAALPCPVPYLAASEADAGQGYGAGVIRDARSGRKLKVCQAVYGTEHSARTHAADLAEARGWLVVEEEG